MLRRRANGQNIFVKLLFSNALESFVAYADPEIPLQDYYRRRFEWLKADFSLPDPTRLRILSLYEMASMAGGAYRQGTLQFLAPLSPETRRSVWELADISAQSQQVEGIINALGHEAQYAKEPGVLAFLAEGALRLNRPDLADQALLSLRAIARQDDDTKMASIPAGAFKMGGDPQAALTECQKYYDNCGDVSNWQDETPIHTVSLDAFAMDAYEVTNAAYARCVTAGVCATPAGNGSFTREKYYDDPAFDNYPVINVNWYDSTTYCAWRGARLPSEAEWEYAARGGLEGKLYPWGDVFEDGQANFCDTNCSQDWKSKTVNDGYGDTSPVGSYPPNGYVLYDMAGNVWEWVYDWYDVYPGGDPSVSPYFGQQVRVLRGGSWGFDPDLLRVSNRNRFTPVSGDDNYGFRCTR